MSKSITFILLALMALSHAISCDQVLDKEWLSFAKEHHKSCKDAAEEQLRHKVFNENRIKIDKHNRQFANGEVSFKMAINEYSDLTSQEFRCCSNS